MSVTASRRSFLGRIGVAVSLAIALLVPVFVARRLQVPMSSVLLLPLQAHLAALVVLAIEVGARGLRLVAIARGLKLPLSLSTGLMAQLCADAAGAVTPSRTGSEPAKVLAMRRNGAPLAGVGAVAAVEMVFEVGGLLVIAAMLSWLAPQGRLAAAAILTYAAVVAMVIALLLVVARRPDPECPPRAWQRLGIATDRWRQIAGNAEAFGRHVRALPRLGAGATTLAAVMTLAHQGARAAIFPALLVGSSLAAGSTTAPGGIATWSPELVGRADWTSLVVTPFSLLYLGALLPPPGGGGGVEVGFVVSLGGILPSDRLPMLLLWWRTYTHYISAVLGALLIASIALRQPRGEGTDRAPEQGSHTHARSEAHPAPAD